MEWQYNSAKQFHELIDKGLSLAKIYLNYKEGVKFPYRTKALLSSLYLGEQKQNALLRKNKEWLVKNRQFKTENERTQYIERKKQSLSQRIQIQESIL
ncbi:MAG: hypothetical protein AABZ60_18045 [Planctomycetota bacterium]